MLSPPLGKTRQESELFPLIRTGDSYNGSEFLHRCWPADILGLLTSCLPVTAGRTRCGPRQIGLHAARDLFMFWRSVSILAAWMTLALAAPRTAPAGDEPKPAAKQRPQMVPQL